MINQSTVVGRLTKIPEIRFTPDGKPVANYQLAVQRAYKKNGEKPTDFIPCVTWGNDAQFLADNAKKGAMVAVRGRWETRSYDHAQFPIKMYVSELNTEEVQLLEWDNEGSGGNSGGQRNIQDRGGYGDNYDYSGGYGSGGGYGGQNNQSRGQGNQRQQDNNRGGQRDSGGYGGGYGNQGRDYGNPFAGQGKQIDINDDDLPF